MKPLLTAIILLAPVFAGDWPAPTERQRLERRIAYFREVERTGQDPLHFFPERTEPKFLVSGANLQLRATLAQLEKKP